MQEGENSRGNPEKKGPVKAIKAWAVRLMGYLAHSESELQEESSRRRQTSRQIQESLKEAQGLNRVALEIIQVAGQLPIEKGTGYGKNEVTFSSLGREGWAVELVTGNVAIDLRTPKSSQDVPDRCVTGMPVYRMGSQNLRVNSVQIAAFPQGPDSFDVRSEVTVNFFRDQERWNAHPDRLRVDVGADGTPNSFGKVSQGQGHSVPYIPSGPEVGSLMTFLQAVNSTVQHNVLERMRVF